MFDLINQLVSDYTFRTVALGSAVLGVVSGTLGSFAVLRRQSLLGDAISHTALPGIALAFLLTGSRMPLVLMLGASVAGWIGTLAVMAVIRNSRIKQDSALGMILAVFFGFGLVLLTFVQRLPGAGKAGLDTFLFGQASALLARDVWTMLVIGIIALLLVTVFWKEFKLLSFDPEFGTSMGFRMKTVDVLLTTLLVIAIVIGLQTVGVVLMSAMVVAPAAAARQWTDRLGLMILLAAAFGAVAGLTGSVSSSLTENLPTGPAIVLAISAIVFLSMLFAPRRGILYQRLRQRRHHSELFVDSVLLDLYELALQHDNRRHPHALAAVKSMSRHPYGVDKALVELQKQGWARHVEGDLWSVTESGERRAARRLQDIGGAT